MLITNYFRKIIILAVMIATFICLTGVTFAAPVIVSPSPSDGSTVKIGNGILLSARDDVSGIKSLHFRWSEDNTFSSTNCSNTPGSTYSTSIQVKSSYKPGEIRYVCFTAENANGEMSSKTYTYTIAYPNATISSVSPSSGEVTPGSTQATIRTTNAKTITTYWTNNGSEYGRATAYDVPNEIITVPSSLANKTGNVTLTVNLKGYNDNDVTESYTYTLKATSSGNANLSDLMISAGVLSPSFSSSTTRYTAIVENSIASIIVMPTATNNTSTVKVNGSLVSNGSSKSVSLNVGSNDINVVVTTAGGTTMTYIITVTRSATTDDIIAPKIKLTPENTVVSGSKISAEATDGSGISEFGYQWEGAGKWTIISGTKYFDVPVPTVTTSVAKNLYVYAKDNSANKNLSDYSTPHQFQITLAAAADKKAPYVELAQTSGNVVSGSTIRAEATDDSGISEFGYQWEGAGKWTIISGTKYFDIPVPTVTTSVARNLYVYAKDNSANKNLSDYSTPHQFQIILANVGDTNAPNPGFGDVPKTHWAYEKIMGMVKEGIISGYNNGTFKPQSAVSRAEFAKIMVLSLKLTLTSPATPSFTDLSSNHWAYKYIESSKDYLTGYKASEGMKFKPQTNATREDVAVALVKAKGYQNYNVDESEIYKTFNDANKISKNLRKYVLIAKKKGLVNGDTSGNFRPQDILTRAEAATMLWQIVNQDDEKVVIN